MRIFVDELLKQTDGSDFTNVALTSGVAVYSDPILVEKTVGFMTLLVTENKSGGAGDVDISMEVSWDGTNFYTPYTTSSGTLTADSLLVEALQNVTRWMVLTARLAKYIRFKFDPDADSQVTARAIFTIEN